MSDLEGVMLSDYFLLECISKGGVADVYRARQNGEGNYEVAVKVFRSGYAQRESFRDYFMTEAEKLLSLIIQIFCHFLNLVRVRISCTWSRRL